MDASIAACSGEPAWNLRPTRPRKRGACTNCRRRKARCDAIGSVVPCAPCSNCAAFSLSCSISETIKQPQSSEGEKTQNTSQAQENEVSLLHPMQVLENFIMHEADEINLYVKFLNPELRHAPILEAGRVAYLGESSNLPFLVDGGPSLAGVIHYQLPEYFRDSRAKLARMGNVEVNLLRQKGALSLPSWGSCDDLVESYFEWIAPALPIIDKRRFMKQYRDPNNPPSLLLLQAIFLAALAVNNTGNFATCKQFYTRAKALYDSGYENDRIINIQALLLIAWYCEKSRCPVEDVLYWNGLATTVALGAGMHRSTEGSTFTIADKRLWRRIWWSLFVRDRSTAILGQVLQIHIEDSDVEMISEDDFVDREYPPNVIHVQFFIHWVKLCILMDTLLSHRKGALSTEFQNLHVSTARFELLLSAWLTARPQELRWEQSRYNFWSTSLQRNYEATLSFLHSQHDSTSPIIAI